MFLLLYPWLKCYIPQVLFLVLFYSFTKSFSSWSYPFLCLLPQTRCLLSISWLHLKLPTVSYLYLAVEIHISQTEFIVSIPPLYLFHSCLPQDKIKHNFVFWLMAFCTSWLQNSKPVDVFDFSLIFIAWRILSLTHLTLSLPQLIILLFLAWPLKVHVSLPKAAIMI